MSSGPDPDPAGAMGFLAIAGVGVDVDMTASVHRVVVAVSPPGDLPTWEFSLSEHLPKHRTVEFWFPPGLEVHVNVKTTSDYFSYSPLLCLCEEKSIFKEWLVKLDNLAFYTIFPEGI